jgi:ATP-dependent DNA helicase RecG
VGRTSKPPRFDDRRTSFWVTFHNHTLMNPEVIAWLNQFAQAQLNDRQRLALVYLRQHEHITNSDYRRLNRIDAILKQKGKGRWSRYTLP